MVKFNFPFAVVLICLFTFGACNKPELPGSIDECDKFHHSKDFCLEMDKEYRLVLALPSGEGEGTSSTGEEHQSDPEDGLNMTYLEQFPNLTTLHTDNWAVRFKDGGTCEYSNATVSGQQCQFEFTNEGIEIVGEGLSLSLSHLDERTFALKAFQGEEIWSELPWLLVLKD